MTFKEWWKSNQSHDLFPHEYAEDAWNAREDEIKELKQTIEALTMELESSRREWFL